MSEAFQAGSSAAWIAEVDVAPAVGERVFPQARCRGSHSAVRVSTFLFLLSRRKGGGPRRATGVVPVLMAGELTERVIGLAIEVHRQTGPGLLESVYEGCLCYELREARIPFARQVSISLIYKKMRIAGDFKADVVVAGTVIFEIKSVTAILPLHEAQLHTYLRISGLRIGLILNFYASRLTEGLRRFTV